MDCRHIFEGNPPRCRRCGRYLNWRKSGMIGAVLFFAFIVGFSYYLMGILISAGGHW